MHVEFVGRSDSMCSVQCQCPCLSLGELVQLDVRVGGRQLREREGPEEGSDVRPCGGGMMHRQKWLGADITLEITKTAKPRTVRVKHLRM